MKEHSGRVFKMTAKAVFSAMCSFYCLYNFLVYALGGVFFNTGTKIKSQFHL